MPHPVGKIIRIKNKFPGPPTLAVNTVGEGLRKHIHLCFSCKLFKPNCEGHCQIAEDQFRACQENGGAVALVRCAHFVPTSDVTLHEAGRDGE